MSDQPPFRATIYTRISEKDAPDDEHGVENQASAAEKLIRDRGWELAGRYTDNDVRASKGKKASADYHRMMAAAGRREFGAIVVFHTSRLWRNRRERADGIEILREAAVSVVAVKGPSLDMSTAYGRAMAGLLGEFDTMETEVKAERQTLANELAARAGKRFTGCPRPFGYQRDHITPELAEAKAVRMAADELLGGATVASVCRLWDQLGVTPTQGAKRWLPNSVRKILRNPMIAGLSTYKGEITGTGNWEPLIPEPQWRALMALLTDPSRRNPAGARTLLGGVAACRCGNIIAASRNGSGMRIYRCQPATRDGRPGPHVGALPLEDTDEFVTDVILERLSRPDISDLLAPPSVDTAALRAEAAGIRASLDRDAVDEMKGALTRSQLLARTAYATKRLAEITAALAEAGSVSVLAEFAAGDRAADVWGSLDLSRKRAVIRCLCSLALQPQGRSNRFDPDSVTFGPP